MACCIALDRDCAVLWPTASLLMSADSEFATDICRLCAEVCHACAEEGERMAGAIASWLTGEIGRGLFRRKNAVPAVI